MARHHLVSILLLAAGLAGCISTKAPEPGTALLPTEQWAAKIGVEEQPRSILLAQHQQGLSVAQRDALADFAGRWQADNGGSVNISFPAGGEVPLVARQSAAMLSEAGVRDVRLTASGRSAVSDPVAVEYTYAEAILPICGRRISDYTATRSNGVDANFGCAVTANLAAQAADPRDLQRPRANDPADGARAAVVVGQYRQGTETGAVVPSGFGSKVVD